VPTRAIVPAAAAIALSAFLLFAVQPLVGRLVLPAYGGAPAAWATVLVAFQAALLAGYAYAHVSATRLGPRRGGLLHLVVLGGAIVVFVVAPDRFVDARGESLPPVLDLLRLLALTVGPVAVALAATTPLLSSWLPASRAAPDRPPSAADAEPGGADAIRRDPYRLYAVSNAGSLVAVVAYPFVVEPLAGVGLQRLLFGGGLVVLAGLIGWVVVATDSARPVPGGSVAHPGTGAGIVAAERLAPARVARWLLLAAVPAGLLSAVTNFIATDLISAPLLWIGPLGTYLVTLVVAFGGHGPAIARRLAWLVPIALTLLAVPYAAPLDWPVLPLLAVQYGGLAIVGVVLHGGLADDRPGSSRLTAFYLAVALGGVNGGAFVGVLAPSLFPAVWEYPILLVAAGVAMVVTPTLAAAAAAPVRRRRPRSRFLDLAPATAGATRRLTVYLAVAGLLGVLLTMSRSVAVADASLWLIIGASILVFGGDVRVFTVVLGGVLVITVANPPPTLFRDRSFFGVVEAIQPEPPDFTVLRHGTTVHSLQAVDPALRAEPAGYFSREGPLGDVVDRVDERLADAPRRTIVTGLGAGTIAAYQRPGDSMTFIEIDEVMRRVAEDAALFTYLADAEQPAAVVIGDGRLELERAPTGSADLVVLDAFASDAVPVHLITAEALADAVRVLDDDGLLAVNVSSRYYTLAPAVAAGVAPLGMTALERLHDPTDAEAERGITTSNWVVATADPEDVAWFTERGWSVVEPAARPLTDDRSDVIRLLRLDSLW
jgi:hypothetical protein